MKQILYKLFEHQYLGRDEARTILQNIAQGKYNDAQVASLITVFLMRNISVEELCGFRDALLEMRVPVDLSEFAPIDIVGTGGDGKNTFNISTSVQPGSESGGTDTQSIGRTHVLQYAGPVGKPCHPHLSTARSIQPPAAPPVYLYLSGTRYPLCSST